MSEVGQLRENLGKDRCLCFGLSGKNLYASGMEKKRKVRTLEIRVSWSQPHLRKSKFEAVETFFCVLLAEADWTES